MDYLQTEIKGPNYAFYSWGSVVIFLALICGYLIILPAAAFYVLTTMFESASACCFGLMSLLALFGLLVGISSVLIPILMLNISKYDQFIKRERLLSEIDSNIEKGDCRKAFETAESLVSMVYRANDLREADIYLNLMLGLSEKASVNSPHMIYRALFYGNRMFEELTADNKTSLQEKNDDIRRRLEAISPNSRANPNLKKLCGITEGEGVVSLYPMAMRFTEEVFESYGISPMMDLGDYFISGVMFSGATTQVNTKERFVRGILLLTGRRLIFAKGDEFDENSYEFLLYISLSAITHALLQNERLIITSVNEGNIRRDEFYLVKDRCIKDGKMYVPAKSIVELINSLVEKAKDKAGRKSDGSRHDSPSMSRAEALEVLGLKENPSGEEIHEAYIRIMKNFHPDKLHDMPEHMRVVFEEEVKKVTCAYEVLRR
jgi:hypothetical protein